MTWWERTRTGGEINLRVIATGKVPYSSLVCFDTALVITCSSTIAEEPTVIVDNSNRRSKCSSRGGHYNRETVQSVFTIVLHEETAE